MGEWYPHQTLYDEMRERNSEALFESKIHNVDTELAKGTPATEKRAVALVSLINGVDATMHRGERKLRELLSTLTKRGLGTVFTPEGNHPDGGLHIMWLQMDAFCGPGSKRASLSMPRLVELKRAVLPWRAALPIKVRLTQLIATTTGVILAGFTNVDVNAKRSATRKSIRVEERTPLSIVGATLLRFTKPLNDEDFEFLEKLCDDTKVSLTLTVTNLAVRPITWRMSKEELTMVDADTNRMMMDYMIESG